MKIGSRPKRPVETVETTFDVIATLGETGPHSLSEISESVGRAPSTIHRHLETLQYLGLVVENESKYELSLRFLDYGTRVREAQDVYEEGEQQVDILADETGERTRLTTLENGMSVLLYQRRDKHGLKTSSYLGQHRPAHAVGDGKAMLSKLPRSEVDELINRYGLEPITEHTITSYESFIEELERTRNRGFGLNLEETMPGLNAIGVAITDEGGRPIGAMSISGPANRLDRDTLIENFSKELMGAANEVEIKMKYA